MTSTESRLLVVPAEIRQRIFQYVFKDTSVQLRLPSVDNLWEARAPRTIIHRTENRLPRELSLLAVNRQLHEECKELVLSNIVGRPQKYDSLRRYYRSPLAINRLTARWNIDDNWIMWEYMDTSITHKVTNLALEFEDWGYLMPIFVDSHSFKVTQHLPALRSVSSWSHSRLTWTSGPFQIFRGASLKA